MARVPDVKRINKEDFEDQDRSTIEKIAVSFNTFAEQVVACFNKGIDFKNLNQEAVILDVTVDASGIPIILTQYKSNLSTRVLGHQCVNAVNLSSPLNTPVSQPFISFVQNSQLVKINKIVGIQANEKYRLTLISIGQ